jgi:hypothetical protein
VASVSVAMSPSREEFKKCVLESATIPAYVGEVGGGGDEPEIRGLSTDRAVKLKHGTVLLCDLALTDSGSALQGAIESPQ